MTNRMLPQHAYRSANDSRLLRSGERVPTLVGDRGHLDATFDDVGPELLELWLEVVDEPATRGVVDASVGEVEDAVAGGAGPALRGDAGFVHLDGSQLVSRYARASVGNRSVVRSLQASYR